MRPLFPRRGPILGISPADSRFRRDRNIRDSCPATRSLLPGTSSPHLRSALVASRKLPASYIPPNIAGVVKSLSCKSLPHRPACSVSGKHRQGRDRRCHSSHPMPWPSGNQPLHFHTHPCLGPPVPGTRTHPPVLAQVPPPAGTQNGLCPSTPQGADLRGNRASRPHLTRRKPARIWDRDSALG